MATRTAGISANLSLRNAEFKAKLEESRGLAAKAREEQMKANRAMAQQETGLLRMRASGQETLARITQQNIDTQRLKLKLMKDAGMAESDALAMARERVALEQRITESRANAARSGSGVIGAGGAIVSGAGNRGMSGVPNHSMGVLNVSRALQDIMQGGLMNGNIMAGLGSAANNVEGIASGFGMTTMAAAKATMGVMAFIGTFEVGKTVVTGFFNRADAAFRKHNAALMAANEYANRLAAEHQAITDAYELDKMQERTAKWMEVQTSLMDQQTSARERSASVAQKQLEFEAERQKAALKPGDIMGELAIEQRLAQEKADLQLRTATETLDTLAIERDKVHKEEMRLEQELQDLRHDNVETTSDESKMQMAQLEARLAGLKSRLSSLDSNIGGARESYLDASSNKKDVVPGLLSSMADSARRKAQEEGVRKSNTAVKDFFDGLTTGMKRVGNVLQAALKEAENKARQDMQGAQSDLDLEILQQRAKGTRKGNRTADKLERQRDLILRTGQLMEQGRSPEEARRMAEAERAANDKIRGIRTPRDKTATDSFTSYNPNIPLNLQVHASKLDALKNAKQNGQAVGSSGLNDPVPSKIDTTNAKLDALREAIERLQQATTTTKTANNKAA